MEIPRAGYLTTMNNKHKLDLFYERSDASKWRENSTWTQWIKTKKLSSWSSLNTVFDRIQKLGCKDNMKSNPDPMDT